MILPRYSSSNLHCRTVVEKPYLQPYIAAVSKTNNAMFRTEAAHKIQFPIRPMLARLWSNILWNRRDRLELPEMSPAFFEPGWSISSGICGSVLVYLDYIIQPWYFLFRLCWMMLHLSTHPRGTSLSTYEKRKPLAANAIIPTPFPGGSACHERQRAWRCYMEKVKVSPINPLLQPSHFSHIGIYMFR